MDVGDGGHKEKELDLDEERSSTEVGHKYWQRTQRNNRHKCKHAFTHKQKHTQNDRLFSLCSNC